MSKVYHYVGPEAIRLAVRNQTPGVPITDRHVLFEWLKAQSSSASTHLLIATYVVRCDETLWVADRHAEHVACANGEPILAAGEIGFTFENEKWSVTEISNQSTGYCPKPCSWKVLQVILDRLPIEHPGEFTLVCEFRRCGLCGEIQIVKDEWYFCTICEADLPSTWNLDG